MSRDSNTTECSKYGDLAKQFAGYVVVGGIAFICDFTTLYVLTDLFGLHYLVSASAGFLLGLLVNYSLCIRWLFSYRAIRNSVHEFALFSTIGIAGLFLNNALLYVFTDGLGFHYLFSKLAVAGIVLVFNFATRRHLLFSDNAYARWLRRFPAASKL